MRRGPPFVDAAESPVPMAWIPMHVVRPFGHEAHPYVVPYEPLRRLFAMATPQPQAPPVVQHIWCSVGISKKMEDVFVGFILNQAGQNITEYVVYLDTMGGSPFSAVALYNFIKSIPEDDGLQHGKCVFGWRAVFPGFPASLRCAWFAVHDPPDDDVQAVPSRPNKLFRVRNSEAEPARNRPDDAEHHLYGDLSSREAAPHPISYPTPGTAL